MKISKAYGFSLVELMVALVIGLLVVLGAGQVFLMTKQAHDRAGELAVRQDALRFISDALSLDIRTTVPEFILEGGEESEEDEGLIIYYGAQVSDGGKGLTLFYDDQRASDPYCSGEEDLISLKYLFSDRGLELSITCGGAGFDSASQLIVSDVDGEFSVLGGNSSVMVDLVFDAMVGEGQEQASFSFDVARREFIVSDF